MYILALHDISRGRKGHLKFKVHKRYVPEAKETLHFDMIIGLSADTPRPLGYMKLLYFIFFIQ